VHPGAVKTDPEVIRFSALESDENRLRANLQTEQHTQGINSLHRYFDCLKLMEVSQQYHKTTKARKHAAKLSSLELANQLVSDTAELQAISDRFARQIVSLVSSFRQNGDLSALTDRVNSGIQYFTGTIENKLITAVTEHKTILQKNKKTARYCKEMDVIEAAFRKKISLMKHASDILQNLTEGATV
jgi:hypothetical protein